MTENQIKATIRRAELKHGIKRGLLEAVAYVEYAKRWGWTDEKIKQLHPDGTSFGLFGLRESTSIEEYIQRNDKTERQVFEMLKTVKGQSEVAGWYLGRRIPQMLRHYKLKIDTENKIIAYNAGISRAITGNTPAVTRSYIDMVKDYINEKNPKLSPWGAAALVLGAILAYFLI